MSYCDINEALYLIENDDRKVIIDEYAFQDENGVLPGNSTTVKIAGDIASDLAFTMIEAINLVQQHVLKIAAINWANGVI